MSLCYDKFMKESPRAVWHAETVESVLELLDVEAARGLTAREVAARRARYGENVLPRRRGATGAVIFLSQFKNPLIFILTVAGTVTFMLGGHTDAYVIGAAVLLNACIGFIQEYKATRALRELEEAVRVSAQVIRDGERREVRREELVPGDIVLLTAGGVIPADARVIVTEGLMAHEAVLTGESESSAKFPGVFPAETPLMERENMVYMGGLIAAGAGTAIVVATGSTTEVGLIASLLGKVKEDRTPYQKKLRRFSWVIALIVGTIAAGIFAHGTLLGGTLGEMFMLAVAVAVAAIPEGLPVAATAILAVGMQRILAERGVVRHLASAETLGSTSVIATDKTLTLTEGRMEVTAIVPYAGHSEYDVLRVAAIANHAFMEKSNGKTHGSPTDIALMKAARNAGITREAARAGEEFVRTLPFDVRKRYLASVNRAETGELCAYVAGAPEALMEQALNVSAPAARELHERLNELAGMGSRVIAVGTADAAEESRGITLSRFALVGLVALRDPVRPGAAEAIREAREAGVMTIMVTGDHARTARAVARETGIIESESAEVVTGEELDTLSDMELGRRLRDIRVYARVTPRHKLRIIEAWQAKNEVIAMTGDGVNDAPALKKADIGIAIGSGTDVAKETADLVLLGDRFSIIPAAIREGRIIIDNIRKVITYLVSGAFSEVVLVGMSLVLGLPIPVLAVQILWVNVVEDALPGIAFMFERGAVNVMRRHPEPKASPLLSRPMKRIIAIITIVSNAVLLLLFAALLRIGIYDIAHVRTFMFVALAVDSLMFVFACRDLEKNIWEYNPFGSLHLVVAVLLGFGFMAAAVYMPFLQTMLHTVPLNFFDWVVLAGFGVLNLALVEVVKALPRWQARFGKQ